MAFINGPVPEALDREVAATPAEFERDLRKAWPQGVRSDASLSLELNDGALRLTILLEPLEPRRIGLLTLPRLCARYRFEGGDERARTALLTRLDRAMQRGGG
ncbi:MAG TPA: hypothetical protein PLN31_01640 [Azoarcus taiwanensis]|uniref:Uncharacterized protein n=1 Tax=Azoarcus taiwanensis TaxID=666964 RepID=A0A972F7N1_9RHOO|nr:hypothetical protein [Azoarcus taiwanensis]NMG03343.1 hypothetical protein [Azoarcus taiwanensis]HRQ56093.1 hypothetical protein [Azoarcus taiwanensis]